MATKKELTIDPKSLTNYLSYESETGKLTWKFRNVDGGGFNRKYGGKEAFTAEERKGYRNGILNGVTLKAHRVCWAIHHGEWPKYQIDHINGVKNDNRISNLRVVTNEKNCKNQGKPKSNTSGYMGVSWDSRMGFWVAKFRLNYLDHHVGYFSEPLDAHNALLIARRNAGFHDNHGR